MTIYLDAVVGGTADLPIDTPNDVVEALKRVYEFSIGFGTSVYYIRVRDLPQNGNFSKAVYPYRFTIIWEKNRKEPPDTEFGVACLEYDKTTGELFPWMDELRPAEKGSAKRYTLDTITEFFYDKFRGVNQ